MISPLSIHAGWLQRGRRPSSAETVSDRTLPSRVRAASTWPPTVVGGDVQHDGDRWASMGLQRGRRPSSAETCARRSCTSSRSGRFNVAADRRRRRPGQGVQARDRLRAASTWPPTVVGGDERMTLGRRPASAMLQRGRRPSSAETRAAQTVPHTPRRGFNVAADRRRRRPAEAKVAESAKLQLQRGRRPSSAETRVFVAGGAAGTALQRGRRPSSAETRRSSLPGPPGRYRFNVAADRRRREYEADGHPPPASTWPPTVVGGDVHNPT